jgi:outer membrane protein
MSLKKTIARLLVALMASLPVTYASAVDQLKIGYVNTQRLFRDAPGSRESGEEDRAGVLQA